MTSPLHDLLSRYVADGTVPGAIAMRGAANTDVETVVVGVASAGGAPLAADAIVRIQSMTKAITAVAALRLVAAGRIALDDPVERWLPELRERRVLTSPTAALDDTVAAQHPITLRHLLTNTSGYGSVIEPSPLRDAMLAGGTETGPEPPVHGADAWLARLAELPLAFEPGEGWRYHASFGVLGILLSRLVGRPLGDHLRDDLFAPLGMDDTAFWVPPHEAHRVPAAYRHDGDALVETEPAGGGFFVGPPPFDVSHGELVSTAADYHRFLRAVLDDDEPLIAPEQRALMLSDQVPARAKTPESFFPGFWNETGWGYGVAVQATPAHAGRWGWSGGQGTDFFVDTDGAIGILMTQVEMGEKLFPLLRDFQELCARGRAG